MANWKLISDSGVSLTFCCENCKAEALGVGPEAASSNGAPMCIDCDQEMVLSAIEVDTDQIMG
jgi:hypothetical protein